MRIVSVFCLLLGSVAAGLAAPGLAPAPTAQAGFGSTLDRPYDPVVLAGADLPTLAGVAPNEIVAFRYEGGWQQIPVQVDERDIKDYADIYNYDTPWSPPSVRGMTELQYVDGETYTGPDSDPTLDGDDETAFMAKDAGAEAPPEATEPANVIPGSGVEVAINDPLDAGANGYVYLFRSDGSLDPGAGQQYVTYDFYLMSGGSYLDTYNTVSGPNPEDSEITTPYYSYHFSDRWITDELRITAGAATGVDILDRHKNLFGPGVCVRSEDTFSSAEGAFIANKSGPVRAIRSYIGANSGPLTQRDHVFYEGRQDIKTSLRVHTIPGVMDFFDYSPDASGMTFYDDLNTSGVTIDGSPDTVAAGAIQWELVSGAQGSLAISASISTNIAGFAYTSYYLDDTTPPVTQCTGDEFAYGSSGLWINQEIPCTDPRGSCTDYLRGERTMYFDAPGLTVGDAENLHDNAQTPLVHATGPFKPPEGDTDGDTIPNNSDPDDDNDGCTDAQEQGPDENLGGRRNPHSFWDFFDANRDGAVAAGDFFAVLSRFGAEWDPALTKQEAFQQALEPPPPPPTYHASHDRTSPVPAADPWDTGPPDGAIAAGDFFAVLAQFGHECG